MSAQFEENYLLPRRPDCYPMTVHAFCRLGERWPDTILRPHDLDSIHVPLSARTIGYDPRTSAAYLEVPGTPMVAVVEQGIVRTFLTYEAAAYKLHLRGFWFGSPLGPKAA